MFLWWEDLEWDLADDLEVDLDDDLEINLGRDPEYLYDALCDFLAHLSRRLTKLASSIPMVRRPPVVRRPHFQTWISLKPVGESWSNFMCSITGVGGRLCYVLMQIGLKLLFSMTAESPHWLIMGKTMSPPFLGCFWSDPFYTCK